MNQQRTFVFFHSIPFDEGGVRRRGGNISVDLSLFVFLFKKITLKKFELYYCFLETKITTLMIQIHYNLQNHPTLHSGERLVNLERRR